MYRSNALKQRVSSLAYTSLAASTDVIVDWYVSRCLPDCMLTSSLTRNDISRSLGRETMSTFNWLALSLETVASSFQL